MSYGPKTARNLNSQWVLSAVSGIGMIQSCCGMGFTMPDVYEQIANRPVTDTYASGAKWDFNNYKPDVITICLGQNDGTANPDKFVATYEAFIEKVRTLNPKSQIVLLTSPMGDDNLNTVMKKNLTEIAKFEKDKGDTKVNTFFFTKSWHGGCGGHPSMDDDTAVAAELSSYLKSLMHW
jgi:lysophospholipase L1-like esterase